MGDRISRDGLREAIGNVESQERRELNRTVWRTVQRWRRRPRPQAFDETFSGEQHDVAGGEETENAWKQIASASESCLSERQKRILSMMREGWRVGDISEELQIPQARVSDEKYKAIVKLRDVLGIA